MKISKCAGAFAALALVGACQTQEPTKSSFVNDICLPSQMWMLSETQNDVFVQPFLKRWRPYDDFVCFEATGGQKFMRRLQNVASLNEPIDGAKMKVSLVNGDEFKTIKTITSTLRVGKKGKGEGEVSAQVLGDSYTQGNFFMGALLNTNNVPNLRLIGTRRCAPGQFNEGRGGARLDTYFKAPIKELEHYNPFYHPHDGRYLGAREFWVMAWRCFRKTEPPGFDPRYRCANYDECIKLYDEKTGIFLNPRLGDVQYDIAQKTFLRWNGAEWKAATFDTTTWEFDYAKYLETFKLDKPQFLFVLLGLNDFCNTDNPDYALWEKRIGIVKESYLASVPDGKFCICMPCSTCGIIDNDKGFFTPKWNALMWNFRKWLIETFDKREQDGYYLIDTAVAIDNEYGYNFTEKEASIPFAGYKGKEHLRVQTGNPHPYPNYISMGTSIAGFIQYWRK